MNDLTTFYLVRHTETSANVEKVLSGGAHDPELTENGIKQAEKLSTDLRGITFDLIVDSGLKRSKQTADILNYERNVVRLSAEALKEKMYGAYEGKPREKAKLELREAFEKYNQLTSDEDRMKFVIYTKGESDEQAVIRFITKLRELAIAYPNKTILVVTHGGIMRYFLIKLGLDSYLNRTHSVITNGAYIQVASDGVDFFVRKTAGIDGFTLAATNL